MAGVPVLAMGAGFGAAALTPRAASRSDIVLAQTADFSTAAAAATRLHSEGASLHFAEINTTGGIDGRKVRVLQLDDAGAVPRAIANAERLMADPSCFALVHFAGASIVESVLPMVGGTGMPFIHPLTGADGPRGGSGAARETFFLRACRGREIDRVVRRLESLAFEGIGVVNEGMEDGSPTPDALVRSAQGRGIGVSAIGVLPSGAASDASVAPAVAMLARAAVPAIVISSAGPGVERFIRGFKGLGGSARLFGFSETRVDRLREALGGLVSGMVVAQVMPSVHASALPVVRGYRAICQSQKVTPSASGLEGYISARLIVQALREAGPQLTRARFLSALDNQSQIGGFPVKDASPYRGSPFVELATVGDGGEATT